MSHRDEGAADQILLVPTRELTSGDGAKTRAKNPVTYGGKPAKKVRGTWASDESAMRLYDGQAKFLVRTALLRSEGWKSGSEGPVIQSGEDVARLVQHLTAADQEHMVVLSINSQNRVIAIYEAAIGTSRGAAIEVKDLVKTIVLSGGLAGIVIHNHPSGNPQPSHDDIVSTQKMKEALSCMGLQLLDHVIVAQRGWRSFFAEGLL